MALEVHGIVMSCIRHTRGQAQQSSLIHSCQAQGLDYM